MTPRDVAIVGASAAGFAVAATLRDEGYGGRITLIGDEAARAYDRPPLSKSLFTAESEVGRIALADDAGWARLGLDLRLGQPAIAVDVTRRTLTLADGAVVGWDALVIATGARARTLPGGGFTLRSFGDAMTIGRRLQAARSVLVAGAGILGCELAALAVRCGKHTTMIDPQAAPMLDRFGAAVAGKLLALHASRGVETRFGVSVTRVLDDARGVELVDGTRIEADLVLVAAGCRPSIGWLNGSGVPLDNGVLCDAYCRALPDVYAAGDVANWLNPRYGRSMRIEHRLNATEQGCAVAANLLGANQHFAPIPFFWTDQHEAKIQVHGLIGGDHEAVLLAGDAGSDAFVMGYRRDGVMEGILGWNSPGQTRKARALIGQARAGATA